jgi:hypothetical protein
MVKRDLYLQYLKMVNVGVHGLEDFFSPSNGIAGFDGLNFFFVSYFLSELTLQCVTYRECF